MATAASDNTAPMDAAAEPPSNEVPTPATQAAEPPASATGAAVGPDSPQPSPAAAPASPGAESASPNTPRRDAKESPGSPGAAASTRLNTSGETSPSSSPRRNYRKAASPPKINQHSLLNVSTYQRSPLYTFQPPARDMSTLKVPGPGAYETPQKNARAHTMPGRKDFKQKVEGPGPGAHDKKTLIGTGPHYSMSQPLSARGNKNPGPGSYEQKPGFGDGPKHSIMHHRSHQESKVPGPGTYDHKNYTNLEQTPKWSLHTSNRAKEYKKDVVPGPGTHEQKTALGSGKKYSHGLHRPGKVTVTPGPGEYVGMHTTFHQS